MDSVARLIRRHDRIRAVWQRTKSLNTARRCECRLSVIRRQAQEAFDAAHARAVGDLMVLRLPDDRVRASSWENTEGSHGRSGPLAVATGSVAMENTDENPINRA